MAKEFFQENDVSYEEKNVAVDSDARDEMIKVSGQMGVPVIIVKKEGEDDRVLVGFDKGALTEALGTS
jgi:glutaredoxin 3